MELLFLTLATLVVLGAILFLLLEIYMVFGGHFWSAPFVRSSKERIKIMLELAGIRPGEIVFDLGSGDGVLVIEAARKGAIASGIELNPALVWYSRWRIKRNRLGNKAHILCRDFRIFPLHKAEVVFAYLMPAAMENLREKFLRELRPGTKIVSNSFPIPGWSPVKEQDKVFLYIIPS